MAVLQVGGQNRGRGVAHHLQIAKKSVLHIVAILEVNTVRGVASLVGEPLSQALWHEDSISIRLDHVVAQLPPADLADLHPDLVEHTPIHPCSCLTLELVELSEHILHLYHAVGTIDRISHIAEHCPNLAREDAHAIPDLSLQQFELIALLGAASVLRIHSKAIQRLIVPLCFDWDGVGTDDATLKALQARRACRIALSEPVRLRIALMPRDLATSSRKAIIPLFKC